MSRLLIPGIAMMVALFAIAGVGPADPGAAPTGTALKFEVRLGKEVVPAAKDGRLLVVLSPDKEPAPRWAIGATGKFVPPVLGKDVKNLSPETVVVLDRWTLIYPLENLGALKAGDYYVQAVFESNRDL
jgi:hypothetical protein